MKSSFTASPFFAVAIMILAAGGGWALAQPGVFSVDESHYLLAAQAAARGSFHIENGFERTLDPSLLYFYTVIPDRLAERGVVATVPPYHSFLAAVFLSLAGASGLVWLNLLAFLASALAVRKLCRLLGAEAAFSNLVLLLFLVGGMSFEYALGLWPHALAQALVLWMLALWLSAGNRRSWLFLSGLLGGMAVGVRLQEIIWLVALAIAWLTTSRGRPLQWLLWLGGWLIPLGGLSAINYHRLDTFNPFTYGQSIKTVPLLGWLSAGWPWLAAAAGCFIIFWLFFSALRKRSGKNLFFKPGHAALVVAAGLLLIPELRVMALDYLSRLGFFLIDPALGPEGFRSQGATIGCWGQEYYGGILKKGLLEAMPFAAAAGATLLVVPPEVTDRVVFKRLAVSALAALLLLPLVLSPGGFCYNPRYLLELAPLFLLLASFQLRAASRLGLLAGLLAGILLALPAVLEQANTDRPQNGKFLLLAASFLAGASLAVSIWRRFENQHPRLVSAISTPLFAAALSYGALIQLGVDAARAITVRQTSWAMSRAAADLLPEKAVLVAWEGRKDVFTPLKLEKDLWISAWRRGDGRPPAAIGAVLHRPVFILRNGIPDDRWEEIAAGFDLREHRKGDLIFYQIVSGP